MAGLLIPNTSTSDLESSSAKGNTGKSTKLIWYNSTSGQWDGLLPKDSSGSDDYHICLDLNGTPTFTALELEDRNTGAPTIYWDGVVNKLYVYSMHDSSPEFWRMDYVGGAYTFAIGSAGSGISVPFTRASTHRDTSIGFTKTPNGDLWAFSVQNTSNQLLFTKSTDDGATWSTAVVLKALTEHACVTASYIINGGITSVCVFVSQNKKEGKLFLRIDESHANPTLVANWVDEAATLTQFSGSRWSDDHCDMHRDSNDNLYIAYKNEGSTQSDIKVIKRTAVGVWSAAPVTIHGFADTRTRPCMGIKKKDSSSEEELIIFTGKTSTPRPSILYKTCDLDLTNVSSSVVFIDDTVGSANFNDPISWQSDFIADSVSGVLAIAHNETDTTYWVNSLTISAPAVDITSPILSLPTSLKTGTTTASGTVTTGEANGALYYLASTNATETAATIKAASSQAVGVTGSQAVSITGLTAGTTYYIHYVHVDSASNESNVQSSASFITDSASSSFTGVVSPSAIAITSSSVTLNSSASFQAETEDIAVSGNTGTLNAGSTFTVSPQTVTTTASNGTLNASSSFASGPQLLNVIGNNGTLTTTTANGFNAVSSSQIATVNGQLGTLNASATFTALNQGVALNGGVASLLTSTTGSFTAVAQPQAIAVTGNTGTLNTSATFQGQPQNVVLSGSIGTINVTTSLSFIGNAVTQLLDVTGGLGSLKSGATFQSSNQAVVINGSLAALTTTLTSTVGAYNALQEFFTLDTVSCTVYNLSTGDVVPTTTDICTEVGTTGLFIWNSTNLTTQPIGYQQYAFKMTNGVLTKGGIFSVFNAEDSTRLEEIWQLLGLDASNPMTVTTTERTFATVTQDITGDGSTTSTVTRQ